MKTLGMIIGVVGVFAMLVPPVGCTVLIVGALVFLAGVRKEKQALEERRHQELLAAQRK